MTSANVINLRPRADLDILTKAAAELSSGRCAGGYLILFDEHGNQSVTPLGSALPLPGFPPASPHRA